MNTIRKTIRMILPRVASILYYRRQYKKYLNGIDFSVDKTKKTILAINHFYDQDLEACQLSNKDFNFIILDGPTLFKSAKEFFSSDVIHIHIAYSSEKKSNLLAWKHESEKIYKLISQKIGFEYLLMPSDSFYWIREFVLLAKEQKVSTIILDKEGTISPFHFKNESLRLKKNVPILSEYAFVWSKRQKEYLEKKGMSPKKVMVLGQARSDLFHLKHTNFLKDVIGNANLPLIVFFSYEDDAYIHPSKQSSQNPLSWKGMKKETHEILSALAQKYEGEYNFIIKTHPQQSDLVELQTQYNRSNLKVIGGSNISNELIQKAKLIVAFQTTIVTEAMYLNKNTIYTYWDKNIPLLKDDLLPFHKAKGIEIVNSKENFEDKITNFLMDPQDFNYTSQELEEKASFVENYLYKPDGNTCNRFFNEIKKLR